MDDTDHSLSQQLLAGGAIQGFDYSVLSEDEVQTLRDATRAIQTIQHATIADVGRHLARARDVLDHGLFLRWAASELGMEKRTVQRCMLASKFLEGKSVTVTRLPPSIIYKLSAQSAPAEVIEAVVAASMTETPMQVQEIAERLDTAREEEKEIQREIARTKAVLSKAEAKERIAQRKEKQRVADAENRLKQNARARKEAEVRQRREGREERIGGVIEYIARTLSDEHLLDFTDMLKDYYADTRTVILRILQKEQLSRTPHLTDPTEWQGKRDICLSRTAGMTDVEQSFLATLGDVGDPAVGQLDELERLYNLVLRQEADETALRDAELREKVRAINREKNAADKRRWADARRVSDGGDLA
jgi:hypothetical protein